MNDAARNWVYKTIRQTMEKWNKNWPSWISTEDLVNEAHLYWTVVDNRYTPVNDAHRMSLFMRCYRNALTDLISGHGNLRRGTEHSLDAMIAPEEGAPFDPPDEDPNVHQAILEAPEIVRQLLANIVRSPDTTIVPRYRVRLNGTEETLNERFHYILRRSGLRLNPKEDLERMVKDHLKPPRTRVRSYNPTLEELVATMVDNYLRPWSNEKPRRRKTLSLSNPKLVPRARQKIDRYLRRYLAGRPMHRVRISDVQEVRRDTIYLAEIGVRCWPPNTEPPLPVQEYTWPPVHASRGGGGEADNEGGIKQRRNGYRFRPSQSSDERTRGEALGPRVPAVGGGPSNAPRHLSSRECAELHP